MAQGRDVVDFSIGDPAEPTPPFIVEALRRAVPAILWLNYPHNRTGAGAPPAFSAHALALAARHGFVVCSDEAYGELTFGNEPATTLLAAGKERALVFHTLSKRSAMTGFRSG